MKTLQKILVAIGMAIAVTATTSANEFIPPSVGGGGGGGSTPIPIATISVSAIRSPDVLRNAALASATRGTRSINAESMDWDWSESLTYTNVTGSGAEDILQKLFDAEFRYRLSNPHDQIEGYVYLYDGANNTIFRGYAQYAPSQVGGEGCNGGSFSVTTGLPCGKPQYNVWMEDIPIFGGAESAEILALGEDGKTANRHPLRVNKNGQIMFPPWMAGALNGLLVATGNDGITSTFQISNPERQNVSVSSEVSSAWNLEGHYVFTDGYVKIVEAFTYPTAFVKLPTVQTLTIDVMGLVEENGLKYFERPAAMTIARDGKEQTVDLDPKLPTVFKEMPVGEYRISFHWRNFGHPNFLYTGNHDDGEKGN